MRSTLECLSPATAFNHPGLPGCSVARDSRAVHATAEQPFGAGPEKRKRSLATDTPKILRISHQTQPDGRQFLQKVYQDEVVAIVQTLEKNFRPRKSIGADALTAFALMQKVDAALPPAIRTGWRWRILYLRALIDKEMHLTKGVLTGDALRDAFAELTDIYHAENALLEWLRPPKVSSDTAGPKKQPDIGMDLDPGDREE